jgi:pyrroloquinoline quinone biosynthesis protein D
MSALPDTAKPRLAAKARLQWDEVRQKPLLLFPEGVLVLNPTANEIVTRCDGQRTVAEIIKSLGEQFGTGAIEQDVKDLLARLIERGLLIAAD